MKEIKIQQLINDAKAYMKKSHDPLHDYNHMLRVVHNAKLFTHEAGLTENQKQALILAAYWHDVGRTLTKKPSIVWMPFFDAIFSSIMLWKATLRVGLFGEVAGLATRAILCTGVGTGSVFRYFFMKRENQILADILSDADNVDILHQERVLALSDMADVSRLYRMGYRLSTWWFFSRQKITLETLIAKKYFKNNFHLFISLIESEKMQKWHHKHFSKRWCKKTYFNIIRFGALISKN